MSGKSLKGRAAEVRRPAVAGHRVKPIRGIYEVREACNDFLRSRGLMAPAGSSMSDNFKFGSLEEKYAELKRRRREAERLDRMAEGMGQE